MTNGYQGNCKGRCHLIPKPKRQLWVSPYALGYVKCVTCRRFFDIEENRCPCCTMLLRHNPRGRNKTTVEFKRRRKQAQTRKRLATIKQVGERLLRIVQ